jgi:hypothetical protein
LIVCEVLKILLSRWELRRPVIGAAEAFGELRPLMDALPLVFRRATPAGSFTCTECGERKTVDYLQEQAGFIHCDCGITPVPNHLLERWEIDSAALLSVAFSGVKLSLRQHIVAHLWHVGKANWAGRSREVWFARSFRRGTVAAVAEVLKPRPKAILFAPTEAGASRWQQTVANLTVPLESALSLTGGVLEFDNTYVEGRILDAGLGPAPSAARRSQKRASRAANIESLRNELIEHLRAARDHARACEEQTGEARLLPRPTQTALGERVGLSKWDVSRCLRDPHAKELQIYWNIALDLDQILAWRGPVSRGAKS